MYQSITEILHEIEDLKSPDEQIALIRKYEQLRHFKPFLRWAVLNEKSPTFIKIPEYKQNMVEIGLSYIKLENALKLLPHFFSGKLFIANEKRKTDRLCATLEEMSWKETSLYEDLVMNRFKNSVINKNLVLSVFPDLLPIT